ncbi:MAG: segregation/condensation protein A [Nanoarchaeota archaeon]|nr:segregation/condensation protein A [Nanoarchaeota archaeon]
MQESNKIGQNQFFDLITGEELSWQTIIYDLIKTEQLDPWDINIGVLADRYIETIQQLETADFFISSKVLLACSLLLRLKSEILVNSYIQDLNDALYGKKDDKKYEIERIIIEEGELPILVPKTPMTRHKKVTLKELMLALNQAIETENRRIKRTIKGKEAEKSALTVMPRGSHIPLNIRIKTIFEIVKQHLTKGNSHMKFSHLAPSKEEKLACFVPMLHLSNDGKVYLSQKAHFEEIHMTFEQIKEELDEMEKELGFATEEIPVDEVEEDGWEKLEEEDVETNG